MKETTRASDKAADPENARPAVDLYDPWQRQFTSHNKQNEFRKAIESAGKSGA
jgi:hypothetical protein